MAENTKMTAGSSKVADEMKRMEQEPILPVEKQLIGWSIGLGVGLLAFLYWLSAALFPGGH